MHALIEAYAIGLDGLPQSIEGLDTEQLRARPIPGKWSALEVICHLADTEAMFAERMKRVIAEDRPTLPVADPDRWLATLACHDRNVADEIALIGLVRRQMVSILRSQPPEAWQRVGIHSTDGPKSLEQIVTKAVDHLKHHLRFLEDKRSALLSGA